MKLKISTMQNQGNIILDHDEQVRIAQVDIFSIKMWLSFILSLKMRGQDQDRCKNIENRNSCGWVQPLSHHVGGSNSQTTESVTGCMNEKAIAVSPCLTVKQ